MYPVGFGFGDLVYFLLFGLYSDVGTHISNHLFEGFLKIGRQLVKPCLVEDPDEKPLFDVLAEYFGEGFKDYIPKDVITIVTNHHLNIDSQDDIEQFFSKYDKEFCLKFLYFMLVHDYGTLSLLSEFETKKKYF